MTNVSGMCALSVLVMTELKCAIVESMMVIRMELEARHCYFLCSLNDFQFALL